MPRMSRWSLWLAPVLVAAMLAAGCNSKEPPIDKGKAAPTPTAAAPSPTAPKPALSKVEGAAPTASAAAAQAAN